MTHEDFKTRYRRILLVTAMPHSHPWEAWLLKYTLSVEYVSPNGYASLDLLDLPAACVVIDNGREALDGVGFIVGRNDSFWPPRPELYLYDEELLSDYDLAML
ncbi:MAG: hypothetical protein ABIS59_02820, partial [Candidatus Saccharibacteria bacterium]